MTSYAYLPNLLSDLGQICFTRSSNNVTSICECCENCYSEMHTFLKDVNECVFYTCCLCDVLKVKNTFKPVYWHTPCAVLLFAVVTFNIVHSWIHTHTSADI